MVLQLGGDELAVQVRQLRKEPFRLRYSTRVGSVENGQILDGARGWLYASNGDSLQLAEADSLGIETLRAVFRSDVVHTLLAAADPAAEVAWLGPGRADGRDADVLEVTAAAPPGGGPAERRLLYLDADDHRLIAEDAGDARMRASAGAVRRIYRDYRTVAGVLWPFYEVRMRGGTKTMTLSVQSLTVNTGVSDRMFEPPTQAAKNQPAALGGQARSSGLSRRGSASKRGFTGPAGDRPGPFVPRAHPRYPAPHMTTTPAASIGSSEPQGPSGGSKYVYFFGDGQAEGNGQMKDTLGGKGAGLAEMTNAGVPVPPGFTITTGVCRWYYAHDRQLPPGFEDEQHAALARLEGSMGKRLGDPEDPLLVSVRSGAKFSMPGMMDTILNLGLNDRSVQGLAKRSGNPRFAWDCYRRFLQMFGSVVLGLEKGDFEEHLEAFKKKKKAKTDQDLTAEDLQGLVKEYKALVRQRTGRDFPQEPREQLALSRDAVFRSWMNDRAIYYRKQNRIPDDLGTAVNVQAMVFGNLGETSATGVGFTRNPATGENHFYGEFLTNAQGEDVVAGVRTPRPIADLEERAARGVPPAARDHRSGSSSTSATSRTSSSRSRTGSSTCSRRAPASAPRRPRSASRSTWCRRALISQEEALLRVEPASLDQLLHPRLDPKHKLAAARAGPCGLAGRGRGHGGVRRRHRGGVGPRQEEGHPGAQGDHARRHPRHGRGAGHPDRDRRHDLARRGGGARAWASRASRAPARCAWTRRRAP